MAKKTKIHCCSECGRDTTRECQICKICMPHFHRSSSHTEEIGRSARPTDSLFEDDFDEERPLLRHDLIEDY